METPTREMTMRVPRRALAWATAAAIAAGGSVAHAADPGPDTLPIHVIAIQTSDADDQAEALTKALSAAVRKMPGWSLGPGDYSLEVLTLSLKCPEPPDANCQSRIADQIKTDRYVWGTLKKKGQLVTGEVHLWARGKGTSTVPIEYTANLTEANEEALRKIAVQTIDHLTGGPPKGPVHIRAGTVAGQVFLDGQPIGALKSGDGSFMVPSGPHKITVKALGFADSESQVLIKPTPTPAEVSLTMVAQAETTGVNWKRYAGFGALGVGVIFAIVGIASSVEVNSVNNDPNLTKYRMLNGSSSDVCGLTATDTVNTGLATSVSSLCSKGKTFQALQIASYPIAAVAGGVGIFLIATSGKFAPRRSGLQIDPQVGPGIGKLDLAYTW
jgi:hypothetical protein